MMFSLANLQATAQFLSPILAPTPTIAWPLLRVRYGAEVWVKHENHLPTGAFKVRGGLVYLDRLQSEQPALAGVITATRGNHGQSIGFAAARLGVRAVIVVPHGNGREKNAAMQALGVELVEQGHDFQAAREYAIARAAAEGLHLIPSWHPDLVRGVATYGIEWFRAGPELDTVYVPIGMGSGICGVIAARDALGLTTRVVGVVSEGAPAYALSFAKGEVVTTACADTIADGIATRSPDPQALAMIRRGAERLVTVSDAGIREAMRACFSDIHQVAEGAGAAGFAALAVEREAMRGKRVGVVLSGGNVDRELYAEVLR
ncbi:MAG: threonine dehydratase [Gemmatimonadota bacterium]